MSLVQIPMVPENYNDVIEYSYSNDKYTKLGKHFKVGDFRSTATDRVLISSELISLLEMLFTYLNATSCKVESGYRTAAEEAKKSGGFQDPHVLGAAADVIFYKNNNPIDSRIVAFAIQDLGFENGGVAPIGNYIDGRVQVEVGGQRYFNKSSSLLQTEAYSTKTGFYKPRDFRAELENSSPSNLAVRGSNDLTSLYELIEEIQYHSTDNSIPTNTTGDINKDGAIDKKDIRLLSKYLSKEKKLNSSQLNRADFNDDGAVNKTDLQLLTAYINEGNSGVKVKIAKQGALLYSNLKNMTLKSLELLEGGTIVTLVNTNIITTDHGDFVRVRTNGSLDAYIRTISIDGFEELFDNKKYFDENGKVLSKKLFFDISKKIFDFSSEDVGIDSLKNDVVDGKSLPLKKGTYSYSRGFTSSHNGIDLAAGSGTPVYAPMAGKITRLDEKNYNNYENGSPDYGTMLEVTTNSGIQFRFGHLKYGSLLVKLNDSVAAGQHIAGVGNTGYSSGNHLHFEVIINGTKVDPEKYFTF